MVNAIVRPQSVTQLDSISTAAANQFYRPFLPALLNSEQPTTPLPDCWVDKLELDSVSAACAAHPKKIKLLVLYGSLRERSFSRLTAYEAARILHRIGADVRVFDPAGLPMKDEVSASMEKVQELRALSEWSDGHFWVSPEQHGNVTGVFKTQIDWIPLSSGSVRPTQNRTLAICQISGGSQSFNTTNTLRQLGRWMRMWTIPNQSSIPKAWTQFLKDDRMIPSSNRDRLVDVCEELVKATIILRPHVASFDDRYSEREEKREHGRLRTQAEVEEAKNLVAEAAKKSAVA